MSDSMAFLVGIIVFAIVGSIFANALSGYSCKVQWKDSGFEYRYSFMSGCQIKNKSGGWIPSDAYREVAP